MQAQHTDREKAVPMFNAFQRRVPDDISRWLAKVSENPIVEAFPEKIDIHPGMDSSMLLPTEMPEVLSELVSKPRTRRTVAYSSLLRNSLLVLLVLYQAVSKQRRKQRFCRYFNQRTSALVRQTGAKG